MFGSGNVGAVYVRARPALLPWWRLARAAILNKAADLYEENAGQFYAMLTREAGKGQPDCEGELREAVDFLRYYAARIDPAMAARGRLVCISPWNFPLAIFTGQIAGSLAAGNAVLAKPAEQTPLIAHFAVSLMLKAGIPASALQLLPGDCATVGAALTSDPRVDGVVFTGSTDTAQIIRRSMAANLAPGAPLIAETGGLNAMIVDSTALPEQAVRDIIASSFQSAGQRCSALRCLYVQEDVADHILQMLFGAMDALQMGDPWLLSTDVGPVIDAEAARDIRAYVSKARRERRVLHELRAPEPGHFVAPVAVEVGSINDLEREIFGPVLSTVRAQTYEEALKLAMDHEYGNGTAIFTRDGDTARDFAHRINVGMIGINVPIPVPLAYHTFGGWKKSGFGDLNQHGPDGFRFYTRTKTITSRWPSGIRTGGEFNFKAMD